MTSVNIFQREIIIPPLLNPKSIGDLSEQITKAENENVSFIILRGSDSVFCKGLDLKWVTTNQNQDYYKEMKEYASCLKKLQTGKCISIAVISGTASGGGMGIACAADYVIASESSSFSLPEGLLGLIPGMILPALLNKLSRSQIKKMVLTGQKYSAKKALEWGIVDEIANNNETLTTIENAIKSMRSCKRDAIGDIKTMIYNSTCSKDELSEKGMQILLTKLSDAEIKEKLTNLSEFM